MKQYSSASLGCTFVLRDRPDTAFVEILYKYVMVSQNTILNSDT